jgi:hypothetical protein
LLSKQGRAGQRGEKGERGAGGEKGERGEPGATVVSWQLDRRRYRVSPLMSDGKVGPALELRALFEQYHAELVNKRHRQGSVSIGPRLVEWLDARIAQPLEQQAKAAVRAGTRVLALSRNRF